MTKVTEPSGDPETRRRRVQPLVNYRPRIPLAYGALQPDPQLTRYPR